MPYAHSPRWRAHLAAPLLAAVACVGATGLALEASPFCARRVEQPPSVDPALAGTWRAFDTTVTLQHDGCARVRIGEAAYAGRWQADTHTLTVDWRAGSLSGPRDMWRPLP